MFLNCKMSLWSSVIFCLIFHNIKGIQGQLKEMQATQKELLSTMKVLRNEVRDLKREIQKRKEEKPENISVPNRIRVISISNW